MRKITDLVGNTYGRLTVISYSHTKPGGRIHWLCKCVCGNLSTPSSDMLKNGNTKSCGCRQRQTHSDTVNGKSHEYSAYHNMKFRCLNKRHKHYHNYGGRGISISDRWLESYTNFLSDMGRAPSPEFSLERIDNNGNYEPSNCKWATYSEQQNNKRTCRFLTFFGQTKTLTQWAKLYDINPKTFRYRIIKRWPVDRLFIKKTATY